MSKAIAIIDMPPSCIGCPFSDPYWDCCLTSESVGDYDAERPDFCPLRPDATETEILSKTHEHRHKR